MAYYEGEISPLNTGSNCGGGSGYGFGGDWAFWIVILLIFGWGNNGWGNRSGSSDGGGTVIYDTGATVQRGFDTAAITGKLDGLANGLCDGFYAQNTNVLNGFSQVQQTLCAGFNGITNGITTQGYETRSAIDGVSRELSDCCCKLQSGIADLRYTMATDTCAIKQAVADSTNAILGFFTQEKISALQAENGTLRAQLSQNAQTATLLGAINRTPTPAYVVPNPYCCPSNGCGYNG